MSEASTLISLNWSELLLGVVALFFLSSNAVKNWDYWKNRNGIKTKTDTEKEHVSTVIDENHKEIENLKAANIEMNKKIDTLADCLDLVTKVVVETRIENICSEILNSANRLERVDISEEFFKHLYRLHKEYERLVEKYGAKYDIENGRIDEAFSYIEQKYRENFKH